MLLTMLKYKNNTEGEGGGREKIGKLSFLLGLAMLRGVFPSSPVFLPRQKQTSPNSNLTRIKDPHENQLRLM